MRTVIFYQGFNRIENRNIIRLEHAKLNRLLGEERRVIERLVESVKLRIEAAQYRLFDVGAVWNELQNHSIVRTLRQKIDLLTDVYPQFLSQVEKMRRRLEEIVKDRLKALKHFS